MVKNEKGKSACLMNAQEASEFLGIKLSTLYHMTSKRKLPFYKLTGGKLSFMKSDLIEWVKSKKVNPVSDLTQKTLDRWTEK